MYTLVEVNGVPNTFYIHKDGKEIGLMIKFEGQTEYKLKIHNWVDSFEYHAIWLVTQDKINQLKYYEKERNVKFDKTKSIFE